MGDLEITPSYMIVLDDDKGWRPAVVLAFKVKVPTAKNRDIGSGLFDYYPYIIIGKKFGHWILNANLGVDFIGRHRDDQETRNQLIYDFSVERELTDKWSVFSGSLWQLQGGGRGAWHFYPAQSPRSTSLPSISTRSSAWATIATICSASRPASILYFNRPYPVRG